jgi:branched-chain amino acid aminotransferase
MISNAILPGITRKSVIQLSKDLGFEVRETNIMREMLYIADEVFFCGTAAEITPVRSVDKTIIGKGSAGRVTKQLQESFFDIVHNGNDKHNWLTFIDGDKKIYPLSKNVNAK